MSADDLLARLRRPITRVNAEVTLLAEAALQAADKIERLHAQIAQMRREHNAEIRELERDALLDEIRHLRAALRDAEAALVRIEKEHGGPK